MCSILCASAGLAAFSRAKKAFFRKNFVSSLFFLSRWTPRWTPGKEKRKVKKENKKEKSNHRKRSSATSLWLRNPWRVKANRDSSRACSDKYVLFIYSIAELFLLVVSFARDLIFIVIVQNNDLSPSSSFFLSIHIYSSSSSSFLPSYHRRRTWWERNWPQKVSARL